MISVELKAKHFYLVAGELFKRPAEFTFKTLSNIKTSCTGAADDDLITITASVDEIVDAFTRLAQRPEGSYNQINGEMLDLLTPQVAAGVLADDPEWIALNERISTIRTQNLAIIDKEIINSKNALYL